MGNRGTFTFPGKSRSQPQDFPVTTPGLALQRPPAGFPGRMWFSSDTNSLSIDDGVNWTAITPVRMVAHSEATVTFNTSTAENDLFNFSLPAGTLNVGDALRITAYGDALNSTGADVHEFRFRFGGSLLHDTGLFPVFANDATRKGWTVDILIQATSLTTQRSRATLSTQWGGTQIGAATWLASSTGGAGPFTGTSTAGAETLTAAVTTRLTVQHVTSSASIETRLFGYTVEKLPA